MTSKYIAMLCLLCTCGFAHAQEGYAPDLAWKKTVIRTICLAPKEDNVKQDTSLLEMMVNAVKAGDLAAYGAYGIDFSTKVTLKMLDEVIDGIVDSISRGNPVTNTAVTEMAHRGFSYDSVHKYRILEEWTVNPHNGKTEIQITGIAPTRDIVGDDGVYRGSQAMFWVRYNEVQPILEKYAHSHPKHSLASLIWDDYFLSDKKPQVQK